MGFRCATNLLILFQTTKYDLTGVVCHSGSSYFGHYISMGRLESLDGKTTEIGLLVIALKKW